MLTWMTVFLDVPRDQFAAATQFWHSVTGWPVSAPRGEHGEFVTLLPGDGDAFVGLQAVGGEPGTHLDLHVTDLDGAGEGATRLGARLLVDNGDHLVLESPGGFPFCLVTHPGSTVPAPVPWPGGRSLVEQVCLDIPPRVYDAEARFWTDLTGWTRHRGEPDEFENLQRPSGSPLRILLQRLDDDAPRVTAHLDVSSDDRAAEVARHTTFGAVEQYEGRGWTTVRDTVGTTYCVTDRVPASDRG